MDKNRRGLGFVYFLQRPMGYLGLVGAFGRGNGHVNGTRRKEGRILKGKGGLG